MPVQSAAPSIAQGHAFAGCVDVLCARLYRFALAVERRYAKACAFARIAVWRCIRPTDLPPLLRRVARAAFVLIAKHLYGPLPAFALIAVLL